MARDEYTLAQLALTLLRFGSEYVTAIGMSTFDLTCGGFREAFLGAASRLHLGHQYFPFMKLLRALAPLSFSVQVQKS